MQIRAVAGTVLLVSVIAKATTLVVMYNPTWGVILGTDSSFAQMSLDDAIKFEADGKVKSATNRCKINACGRYLVAGAGIWGMESREIKDTASVCQELASRYSNIDAFTRALEREMVTRANILIANVIQRKGAISIGGRVFALAVTGFEQGHPVLRFRDVIYGGTSKSGVNYTVKQTVACPGSAECADFQIVTGETSAIQKASDDGAYKNATNLIQRTEDLLNIEIRANATSLLVLPPISIVEIKDKTPTWVRTGLCGVH